MRRIGTTVRSGETIGPHGETIAPTQAYDATHYVDALGDCITLLPAMPNPFHRSKRWWLNGLTRRTRKGGR